MPTRKHYLVTRRYYHIYNKTIEAIKPFQNLSMGCFFLNLVLYYRHVNLAMSYSRFLLLNQPEKESYIKKLQTTRTKFDILAYTLMPNHFHLLLKQRQDNGISSALRDSLNSFTKHYNSIHQRMGPIFLPRFKSKPIHNEERLIHVSRYIHLNPYVSGVVSSIPHIWSYPLSSAASYLHNADLPIESKYILENGYFLGKSQKYRDFVENEAQASKAHKLLEYTRKWDH